MIALHEGHKTPHFYSSLSMVMKSTHNRPAAHKHIHQSWMQAGAIAPTNAALVRLPPVQPAAPTARFPNSTPARNAVTVMDFHHKSTACHVALQPCIPCRRLQTQPSPHSRHAICGISCTLRDFTNLPYHCPIAHPFPARPVPCMPCPLAPTHRLRRRIALTPPLPRRQEATGPPLALPLVRRRLLQPRAEGGRDVLNAVV